MSLREPARGYLTGVANNPRSGWLEYFGLPEDIDEWTIEDLRGLVVTPAPAFPAESPETKLQVTLADFRGYLESVGNPYRYLTANRPAIAVGRPAAGGCNGDGGTSSSAQDTPSLAGVPE